MKKFIDLQEAPKTVAFTFGRFNPPTIGHEKLLDKLKKVSADKYMVFASHSQNPKKDPLQYAKKIAYMKQSFPKHKRDIVVSKSRTFFEILVELNDKFQNIVMVVGSDRVTEFKTLANKYNGVASRHGYYKFENIEIVSAGERDPDAEGATGMSASKMRAAAVNSDFDSFKQGTPLGDAQAKKLYFDVRKSMGIKEELNLSDFEVVRDLYLSEQIWNVGDLIITRGKKDDTHKAWEIIRKGTNYVTGIDENYKVEKIWLHDILIDENQKVKQDKDIKDREGTQPAKYYGSKIAKSTKTKRAAQFAKQTKMDDDNPDAYKPAPGDATGKTKPSKHTKKFKQMFGDETNPRIPRKKGQPAKSKKHSDLYTDEDPVGTIHGLGFKDVETARASVKKIENSDRTHAHKIQAAVAMEQRAKEMGKKAEAAIYRTYIEKMKKKTKRMREFTEFMYEKAPDTQDAMKRYKAGKAGFTDIAHLKAKGLIKRADGTKRKSEMNEARYEIKFDSGEFGDVRHVITKAEYANMIQNELQNNFRVKAKVTPGKKDNVLIFDTSVPKSRMLILVRRAGYKINELVDINEEFKFFPDNMEEHIQIPPPPQDEQKEMGIIRKFISTRTDEDVESVKNHDEDSKYAIKKYMDKIGVKFHKNELQDIVNQTSDTIDYFKEKFNRDRPFEIDGNLDVLGSKTNKTRSYPSGHSAQSFVVALYVANKLPREHRDNLLEAAKECGMGRVKAGFHFLSDHLAGQMLGQKMFELMNRDDYGKAMKEYYEVGTDNYVNYLKDITPGEKKKKDYKQEVSEEPLLNEWGEVDEEAEYQGRKVKLNNPTRGDVKKFKVYVRNKKGNVIKVEFGDPNMDIKRDSPERLKAFRARHNCDQKKDKTTAGYWSCKFWEKGKTVTDLMKG